MAPADQRFIALVVVEDDEGQRIYPDLFFGADEESARSAALASGRAATEGRKLARIEEAAKAKLARPPRAPRTTTDLIKRGSFWLLENLFGEGKGFAGVGREVGLSKESVKQYYNSHYRYIGRKVRHCLDDCGMCGAVFAELSAARSYEEHKLAYNNLSDASKVLLGNALDALDKNRFINVQRYAFEEWDPKWARAR